MRKDYKDIPEFLGEIIQEFGNLESLDKKIWRARAKTEGKQPDNRDDFDPSQYYREHEGEDIVVIDSNNVEDLPEGWKNALKRPVDTAYLIIVIFFTLTQFLENKIYTEKRQFFALNL